MCDKNLFFDKMCDKNLFFDKMCDKNLFFDKMLDKNLFFDKMCDKNLLNILPFGNHTRLPRSADLDQPASRDLFQKR